jgi:hypothetical protein
MEDGVIIRRIAPIANRHNATTFPGSLLLFRDGRAAKNIGDRNMCSRAAAIRSEGVNYLADSRVGDAVSDEENSGRTAEQLR